MSKKKKKKWTSVHSAYHTVHFIYYAIRTLKYRCIAIRVYIYICIYILIYMCIHTVCIYTTWHLTTWQKQCCPEKLKHKTKKTIRDYYMVLYYESNHVYSCCVVIYLIFL